MKNRIYFDSDLCLGKRAYKHPKQKWRTEDVLREMDRTGIAAAFAYHGLARHYSPEYGNRLLLDELAKSDRLYGCWVLLPDGAGDFPDIDSFLDQMREKDIRLAKMFPKSHYYAFDVDTVGRQLAGLEKAGIPLLLEWSEVEYKELSAILGLYPALQVLVQGASWGQERFLYSLMDKHPNMLLDFTAFQSNENIEFLCGKYGAQRLIFATNMPHKSPGAHRALIDYARISEEDKDLIAYKNLSRLTRISPRPVQLPDQDSLMLEAALGQPISVPVFDSHTHLIEDGGSHGTGRPMLRSDIQSMLLAYDRLGIDKMTIAAWLTNFADYEGGNESTLQGLSRYPERVVGYAGIDPNYSQDVAADAYKWHIEAGLLGLKPFYHLTPVRYTDGIYQKWWELANEKQLFCLADPGAYDHGQYMQDIDELARRYPEVSFFMDHAGRSFEVAQDYARVARANENVSLQLTYTTVPWGMVEYLTGEVGAKKVMFGTDAPMRDPRQQLGWVVYADIPLADKKLLLAGNMQRVLDRCR